ncbi:M91 family zinc metallopeptidase [Citrobacter rodentium]|uniref:T3SS effector protein NleD n=2 Tax=Citrobacter rodentium TaxID=67825 RepID=D2TML3_CITRI|nr:M91 family zinc metallopeptidase [Citrobacter rodentium]KIQ51553.1 T3SS effector protein NleD [Citrobacter rodentium]QBY30202.1 T3SS effector protein NleD [Citrobacter rodentium]QBY31799.1 T3SS effector protein NleD [Citrobacter rodentium]UHO30847.1 type III secretion system effector protein [Citrobacter rodentium NBRC 105723 = DSM 16636]UHO32422.1 type III secretion system effector protein [Citrobacter rodentium NBRC 105723 = DSM 16636]
MRPTSLNLTLPSLPLPSSSNSISATDIQSLVKMSGVRWVKNNQQLCFHGTDLKIYQHLEAALDKIESTDTGRTLLNCIELTSRLKSEKLAIHLDSAELGVIAHCNADAENSRGTGSDFHCNLNAVEYPCGQGISLVDFHACIVFHELLHVFHNLNGERLKVESSQPELQTHSPLLLEEARTVGLGAFSEEVLSENKFREEIGMPRRTFYPHDSSLIHDDNTVTQGFQRKKLHPLL